VGKFIRAACVGDDNRREENMGKVVFVDMDTERREAKKHRKAARTRKNVFGALSEAECQLKSARDQ
jgi:hypothetical protein